MATPVKEYLLDHNDIVDMDNLIKLREAVKGKTCETIMKNKKVCGRHYAIFPLGYCGCRFHEDYSHALQALKVLKKTQVPNRCQKDDGPAALKVSPDEQQHL